MKIYNVGIDAFSDTAIKPVAIKTVYGDVTGDRIEDTVSLMATKGEFGFFKDAYLSIKDGKSNQVKDIQLIDNTGYGDVQLFLGDFTGDGVDDIFLSIFSGEQTEFGYVYSFEDGEEKLLTSAFQLDDASKFVVDYLDYYRLEVISNITKNRYILDISQRGSDYLDEFYDKSGKLKQSMQGFVLSPEGFYPIDLDRDGQYEILVFQRVCGTSAVDAFGIMQTYYKYKSGSFVPMEQYLAIYGEKLE